jgi:hypothetical protein
MQVHWDSRRNTKGNADALPSMACVGKILTYHTLSAGRLIAPAHHKAIDCDLP